MTGDNSLRAAPHVHIVRTYSNLQRQQKQRYEYQQMDPRDALLRVNRGLRPLLDVGISATIIQSINQFIGRRLRHANINESKVCSVTIR